MSTTKRIFQYTNSDVFQISDKWATLWDFRTIEKSSSSRLYETGSYLSISAKQRLSIKLNKNHVEIESWIYPVVGDKRPLGSEGTIKFLGIEIEFAGRRSARDLTNKLLDNFDQDPIQ